MSLSCRKVQDMLMGGAAAPSFELAEHMASCRECRVFQAELDGLLRSALDGAGEPPCDWSRLQATIDAGTARLAVKRRWETVGFLVAAGASLAGFWLGLGAFNPRLPLYIQGGILANLSLFFLPIHLIRRRGEA